MTKEEKAVVINNLAEQLNEYPHFYLTDIETLNAEQTAQLRSKALLSGLKWFPKIPETAENDRK